MQSVRQGRDLLFHTVTAIAIGAIVLQPTLAVGQAVTAGDLKKAEAKAEEAKAYFKSQLFAEAADAFMEAFAISKRPDMMYNAARAQEEGKLYAKALALFARYVGLADAPDDGKQDARDRMTRLKALIDAQKAQAQAEQPAPVTPPPLLPPAPVPPPQPVTVTAAPTQPPPVVIAKGPPPEPPARWPGWAMLGGGSLLLLVGLGGIGSGNTNIDKVTKDFDFAGYKANPDAGVKAYRDQVQPYETTVTLGGVVALGGLALAGIGGWRLWGPQPKQAAVSSWRLLPDLRGRLVMEASW